MAAWTFNLTNKISGTFEVADSNGQRRMHGQAPTTTYPKIAGGLATEPTPGTVRVLVTFEDGRTGEFQSAHRAGQLDFVKYV